MMINGMINGDDIYIYMDIYGNILLSNDIPDFNQW